MKKTILLASASPRRRMLLEGAGIPFEVRVSEADETTEARWSPSHTVLTLARRKARAVYALHPDCYVIGADTLVSCAGKMLGKPVDEEDAAAILKMLSARTHQVQTGVCVILPNGTEIAFCETSHVTFRPLTQSQIMRYIATGEPMDKAGAYAIQGEGRALIERFTGDYANIIGLPVDRLVMILQQVGAVDAEDCITDESGSDESDPE